MEGGKLLRLSQLWIFQVCIEFSPIQLCVPLSKTFILAFFEKVLTLEIFLFFSSKFKPTFSSKKNAK